MKINEFAKAIFLPVYYILNPSRAGLETSKISITSAAIQAALTLILVFCAINGISINSNLDKDTYQMLLTGLATFPLVMILIGSLLHLTFPAQNPENRFFVMLSVPWNVMASTIAIMLSMLIVEIIYILTSDLSSPGRLNEMTEFGQRMMKINGAIMGVFFVTTLTYCLSNIRKTSKLRNVGDSVIVTLLFSIPFLVL